MDHPHHGGNGEMQTAIRGPSINASRSADDRYAQGPHLLQKPRSDTIEAIHARRQDSVSQGSYKYSQKEVTGLGEGTKARKGSLRSAVRRIFGRRSREADVPPRQTFPPTLEHPTIDPFRFTTHEGIQRGYVPEDEIVQRTLSAPIPMLPATSFSRPRSPYGFPHSAKLKPLDLGNPFAAAGPQLRRRKSMPSTLITEPDAELLLTAIGSTGARAEIGADFGRNEPVDLTQVSKQRRSEKRISRSADDLRRSAHAVDMTPPRSKEEMRQWRESLQGSVLRASGFKTLSPVIATDQEREGEKTPLANSEDPFERAGPLLTTPALQREASERDVGSASALGIEISRDLEDRVARLEAGLQSFRGQLAQLSTDRNRRTVLIGGLSTQLSANQGDRTASMLATDLQSDLRPSNYRYDYSRGARPTTSPRPPRTPTHTDPSAVTPDFSIVDRSAADPFISPPRRTAPTGGDREGRHTTPQYAFKSLYEMLADERSARRRLETQMRALREEISNLHYQVSQQSNLQSQRSSYYATGDPMVGSSRLHALLRDTDVSPPSTAHSQQHYDSGQFSTGPQDLMSRFSGSESEMGGAGEPEELGTPHDAYQTPLEVQGPFTFGDRTSGEGEMF